MALPLDLFAVEYKKRRPQADEREILEAYTQVGGGKPEGFIGFGQAFGSGIMSGFYGLGSALGSFGELVGLDTGGFASDMEQRARQYAPPDEVQQYLYENPSKIFDPNWLAYTTGQVVPSALLTILGGGIAGGAAKIAGLGQKGVRAAQIAGAVVPGTALEAGGFYRETPDRSQALLYGLLDAPLQVLPAERLFRALGGTRPLASLVQAAAGESLQEWSEEPLAAAIRGDDIMQAMKEGLDVVPGTFLSTLLTGGLGVGVGQLRNRMRPQEQAPQSPAAVFSEAIPSKELPEGAFLEESSPVVKDYITRQAAEILTGPDGKNELLSTLGIEPVAESPSVGAYDESLNPNIVTVLPPGTPQEVVDLYAKSLRYIYKQDAVPWSQIQPVELPEGFSGNAAVGVRVGLENADQETQRKLFKVLRSYLGKDAGFTVMPDDGSALIVNYGGMDDAKFVGRLISMAKRHADDLGITEVAQVSSIGDYNGEQGYWKSDPEGRNLYDEIRQKSEDLFGPRGREFHRQVRDRRAAFDGLLQKEIGQDLLLKDLGAPAPKKTLKPGDPLLQETITKPGREKLQQSLAEKAFENVTPSDQPVAVLMGGGGASGKGFILNMLQESGVVPKNAVTINPDDVKPLIPEYKEIAKKGDYRAAEVVHEESSKISSDIMQKAIKGRYNLIIDKTLGNPDKAKALIQSLKEQGYRVELYGVTTPTDNAIKQMVGRAKRSGRHVRVGDMLAAHKGFAIGFEDYAKLADRAALIHNQGKDQSVVASAENGQLEIIDPERYNLFTKKARLNPNARAREEIAGDTAEQAPVRQGAVEPAQEGAQRYALADYLSGERLSVYKISNDSKKSEQLAADLEKLSKYFDEKGFMMRRGEVTDKLRDELRVKVSTFEQINLAPLLKKAGFKNPQPVPQELLPVLENSLADVLTVVPERAFENIGAIFVDEFDGDAAASYSPPTPMTPGLLMVNRQQLEALNTGGYPNLERDFRFTLAHELTHAFDIGLKGNISHAVASELLDWDPLEVDAKNIKKDGKVRAQFDPGPGAGEILYEIADYWNKNDDRIAKLFNYPILTMGADLLLMRKNLESIEQATGMKPEQIRDAIRKLRRGEELYPEEQLTATVATPGYIELVKEMTKIRNHFNAEIMAQLGAIYSTYPEELKAALPQSYKLIEEIFNGPATSSAISAAVRESPESAYYDIAKAPRWAIAGRGVEVGAPERYPIPAGVDRSGAQSYGEYVETRRRGTQPWELTEELAKELGVDPARVEEILRRRLGEAYNAEQIENVGLNLRQSVQRLYDYAQKLAEKAKTGEITDAERLQFEQYEEELAGLVAEFFGVRAEAGRALNILKKLSGTTQQAQVIREYLNSKGGADLVDARIELMANMDPDTIEGRQGIARGAAIGHKITAWDMLVEYYKAMLLTGPPTHVVNAVSNETRNILEGIENFVTAGIGLLRGNKDRLKFKAAMEYMNAHLTGLSMGVHEASKVKLLGDADAEKAEIFKEAIPGKIGKVVRIPFQLLSKLDAINRTAAYHQTLRMLAVQKGFDPNEVTQNPPKELREEAEKQAARLIYTDTGGPIVQALNQMRSRVPALNFIFPFVRTPANIVRDAMRHMPGVSMLFSDVRKEWNKGGWYRDRVIARQAVGFAIGAVVWQLAAAGLITGGPPDDPAERRAWELEGIQPWSIKIGDTWYAYNRIDPIGILFGLAADAWRFKEALGTKDADKLAALVMGSIASNLTNKTYLSGLSDLISAMQDPLIHADRAIKRFAGSLIVPTGVAYVARAIDPYLRQTETIMDAVRARIPVMSMELAPKLDVVGRPRMRESGPIETMISPIWKRTQRYDNVAQELMRLQVSFPYPPKKYRGVKLDPEVRNELITTLGKPTYNVLKRLVKTKSYNAFPDPVKKWILERVISRVRSSARLYWSKLHPEIMREAKQLELEKYLGR